MHGVIGPGGRGVIIVSGQNLERARETKEWLAGEDIRAMIPAEEGLFGRRGARHRPVLGPEMTNEGWFWATALRRPAVVQAERVTVAFPDSSAVESDRGGALDALRDHLDDRPQPRVAVFGGAWVSEDEPEYGEAMTFGRLCAEGRLEIVNGGYGGIMAAVSRGAAEAPALGTIVGVTIGSFSERVAVNRWLTHEVEAADLFARLPLICDAEAWVAFPGGVGTLAEIALCWNLVQTESVPPRPLIIVGEHWDRALRTFRELLRAEAAHFELVLPAASAEEAFDIVEQLEGTLKRDAAPRPPGFEVMQDVTPAAWAIERLEPMLQTQKVASVVPDGFDAYARIFHPVQRSRDGDGETVLWSDIARERGTVIHTETSWRGFSGGVQGSEMGEPRLGSLSEDHFSELAELLRSFTSTPRCFFCLWEGWGHLEIGTGVARVELGNRYRTYIMYRGSIEEPPSFRMHDVWWQSPNMWWPEDRAWFVATEIDNFSTFVGGSRACIDAILEDPRLEAMATGPDRWSAPGE